MGRPGICGRPSWASVFASLILVTGVIWAKADLGWWWTWGRQADDDLGAVVHIRQLSNGEGRMLPEGPREPDSGRSWPCSGQSTLR